MTSIPQLRKDINDLQENLRARDAEIMALKKREPEIVYRDRDVPRQVIKVVEKEVPGPERIIDRIEYQDYPDTLDKLKKARSENRRLKASLEEKPKVEYRDNPKHIKMIKHLRSRLNGNHA